MTIKQPVKLKPQTTEASRWGEVKEQERLKFCYDRPQTDKVFVLRANPVRVYLKPPEVDRFIQTLHFVIQPTCQERVPKKRLKCSLPKDN